jgi:hypothetical protein
MRVLLIFSILLLISIIVIEGKRRGKGQRKSKRRNNYQKKSFGKFNWKMINTNVDKYVLLEKKLQSSTSSGYCC